MVRILQCRLTSSKAFLVIKLNSLGFKLSQINDLRLYKSIRDTRNITKDLTHEY